MRGIDRFNLTDKVSRALQNKMSFEDIERYLAGFGVNTAPKLNSYSSKWIYAKELLGNAPEQVLINIADELEVPHNFTVASASARAVAESTFWEPNNFRLFISHLSSTKESAGKLRQSLRRFAISGFVAHDDIDPTREWQDEIEAALFSMDALAAIIVPGFFESKWADQEIGVAIGREKLVVPIMREATPHGFIGKFQGLNGKGRSVPEVADALFRILIGSPRTRSRMFTCLVDATSQESTAEGARTKLILLESIDQIPTPFLEKLREGALKSTFLVTSPDMQRRLKRLLEKGGLELGEVESPKPVADDDIPF